MTETPTSSIPLSGRSQETSGGMPPLLRRLLSGRLLSMLVVFLLLTIYFHVASNGIFFSPRNVTLLLRQASIVAVVAAGVSILMVMGEIDLSIGSAAYLCSVVSAILQVWFWMPTLPAVLITIAVGVLLGAWHAVWVIKVGVPSFVVTLAGLLAFRGLGYQITSAQTIAPLQKSFTFLSEGFVPQIPSYFVLGILFIVAAVYIIKRNSPRGQTEPGDATKLAGRLIALVIATGFLCWAFGGYQGIPVALIWVAGIGALLGLLMMRSKFGRNAYMIGSNREAAVLSGISLSRELFLGFLLMGALYGVAGILTTARLGASTPSAGTFMELDAIAGAVIGGTSLRGGVGTTAGAMVGAVLLTTIDNGMSILNVSSFLQLVVKGLVLLLALAFDAYMTKHRTYRA